LARKHVAALTSLACLALALAPDALAQYRGGAAPPRSATDSGEAINQVYWVVFAACALVFVLVEAVLVLFIVRFRRRVGAPDDVEGPQIHGNTRLEIFWTVIPALALVGLAVFTFARIPAVQAKPDGGSAGNALEIGVEAHQFYWQYEYPNGALSFDTLYLPVDRTVTLRIESRDVPHSWWVPQLTGKLDAIPGQANFLHFKVKRTGTFTNGKCGEFCGIQHAVMLTTVRVLSQEEFDRWLDDNEPTDEESQLVAVGQAEWEAACAKCHGLEGEGDIGPPIAGNGALVSRDALLRLLGEGQNTDANQGYMPPVGKGWNERQVDALMAYVQSNETLAPGEEEGGG
jgi:cytochrome c oxidase subunit 2